MMKFIIVLITWFCLDSQILHGQNLLTSPNSSNNVKIAPAFLLMVPYAKAGGMGNSGSAIMSDEVNIIAMNPALLAFTDEGSGGFALSYAPLLKDLGPNMSLSYLSGYYHLDNKNSIAASLRYFAAGTLDFTTENLESLGTFNPSELAVDINYTRSFGPNFALGGGVRYINSNLFNNQFTSLGQPRSANAMAVDISGAFKNEFVFFDKSALLSAGFYISNLGPKSDYGSSLDQYFLPANLKLGVAGTFFSTQGNQLTLALDLNKLLTPSSPIYDTDGNLIKGSDPDKSVTSSVIGSFSDAPNGFAQELQEIFISSGLEYSFQKKFALRAGYSYQHPKQGPERVWTIGAGFNFREFGVDVAYMIGEIRQNPMARSLRFGIQMHLR